MSGVHAARFADTSGMRRGPRCEVCHQPIKRVPGWVHTETGAVLAADPPFLPELVPAVETVQAQVVANVMASVVDGVQLTATDGSIWVLAPEDPYVIRVDSEGTTMSAYLIAGQPDANDTPGWATGWDI